jgi:hypothetical protein
MTGSEQYVNLLKHAVQFFPAPTLQTSSVTVSQRKRGREGVELNEGLRGCKAVKQKTKMSTLAKAWNEDPVLTDSTVHRGHHSISSFRFQQLGS